MKSTIYLLTFLLIPYFSNALHYRTLINGNWNNTTNVWSTNGSTPCGCAPPNNLVSDSITINHPLSLTAHLAASASSKLQINNGGSLTNSLFDVNISNSIFLANGSINIKRLIVQSGGAFNIANSVLMLNGSSTINGTLTTSASYVYLLSGNLDISAGAQFNVLNGTRLQLTNGNIRNYGQLSICATCCIAFDKGGINNESAGQVLGDGAVLTYNGNFKNLNIWSTGVDYCSSGTDQGMPLVENCNATNSICLNSPLSTTVLNFRAEKAEGRNNIFWESIDNEQSDHFVLSKSLTGNNWEVIDRLANAISSTESVSYRVEDSYPYPGTTYYQLSLVNLNADTLTQLLTSIENNQVGSIHLFPNPSGHSVTLTCSSSTTIKEIYLYSPIGELLLTKTWPMHEPMQVIELPLVSGVYFLTVSDEHEIQHFKIRITGH